MSVTGERDSTLVIAEAMPIAEKLVKFGETHGTKNLTVWILALKMAAKIEIELYRQHDPEASLNMDEDLKVMDEVVANMHLMPDPRAKDGDGFQLRAVDASPSSEPS